MKNVVAVGDISSQMLGNYKNSAIQTTKFMYTNKSKVLSMSDS